MEDRLKTLVLAVFFLVTTSAHADWKVSSGQVMEKNSEGENAEWTQVMYLDQSDAAAFNFYEDLYGYSYGFTVENGVLKDPTTGEERGSVSADAAHFSGTDVFEEEDGTKITCLDDYVLTFKGTSTRYENNYTCDNGFTDLIYGTLHGFEERAVLKRHARMSKRR